MSIRVARASTDELHVVRAIRRTVFVEEQAVPVEVEEDGRDDAAEHFLARLGTLPVATARARHTPKGWKVERVAVLRPQRQLGVGRVLVCRVLEHAPPGSIVYVHAQESALGFWERLGFVAEGPRFEEGGIGHRRMVFRRTAPVSKPGA
jgi:predicted GNAT family N-acyltransferase